MIGGILLCAGSATRMGFDKLRTPIGGRTAIERSAELLVQGGCETLVLVGNEANEADLKSLVCGVPSIVVRGGATRTESVRNGLRALLGAEIVAIHDAARCFVPADCVARSIESAKQFGSGVLALANADTVVRTDGTRYETLDRTDLYRTQTPQTFRYAEILRAYETATEGATDDAALYARVIGTPHLVPGSDLGRKLTTAEDWAWANEFCHRYPKIGTGFDTHRLVEGRKLILGGVEVPYEKGLLGHSDADVLIHAVIDALLGAAALGDIGKCFPDSDEAYRGIDSRILLRTVADMVQKRDMKIQNVDAIVLCQRPKLRPYIDRMRTNLAADLGLAMEHVSVKATTTEGMNDEGRGLCISASAIAMLV
jgi:2-C-methyl-D-erythritol 2,4-cyclodiphosphate synthase/2-C-methyl-D-erythritol 4-phosphate cytidylyltransferase